MSNYFVYIYYGQFLVLFALVFVLVWVLIVYMRMLSKYKKLEDKERFVHTSGEEEVERMLTKAREQSHEILISTLKIGDEEKIKFAEILERSIQSLTENLAMDAKELLDSEIRGFAENLIGELRDARAEMDVDMQKYKEEVAAGLEEKAKKAVREIVENVIGGGLSEEKQEELIFEAIEDAKKRFG